MGITEMQQVPAFETGQVLGRAIYGTLFENDLYLTAFADRLLGVPRGCCRTYIANETGVVVWDGWVYVDADHGTLNWWIAVESDDDAHPSRIRLYFDGDNTTGDLVTGADIIGDAGYEEASGAFDVSGYSTDAHRVYCRMTRAGGDTNFNATGECRATWLSYDNGTAYAAGPATADGNVPTAANFNVWRSNDAWFTANLSPNQGFCGVARSWVGNEHSLIIWNGYVDHDLDMMRVSYHASMSLRGVTDLETLEGWYNVPNSTPYNHANWEAAGAEHFVIIADTADHEGTFDLVGVIAAGTKIRVCWVLTRQDHVDTNTTATITYTFLGPAAGDAGFSIPTSPAVSQYVFGNTAGETTRAELLTANDAALYGRRSLAYRHFANHWAGYSDLGSSAGTWFYTFRRQGNYLYYRASAAQMTYGLAETVALEAYDDAASIYYRMLDLRELDGLLYGMEYTVEQTGTDGLEWAIEIL